MSNILFTPLVQAFLTVPAEMAFAKCVPHSVEGIMMGLTGSIVKINSDIIMRLVGLAFLSGKDITRENYTGLSSAIESSTYM